MATSTPSLIFSILIFPTNQEPRNPRPKIQVGTDVSLGHTQKEQRLEWRSEVEVRGEAGLNFIHIKEQDELIGCLELQTLHPESAAPPVEAPPSSCEASLLKWLSSSDVCGSAELNLWSALRPSERVSMTTAPAGRCLSMTEMGGGRAAPGLRHASRTLAARAQFSWRTAR